MVAILEQYLTKKETILVIGPDIFKQLGLVEASYYPESFLKSFSLHEPRNDEIDTGLDFLEIFELIKNIEGENYLIKEMQEYCKKITYLNQYFIPLASLLSTEQPTVIYYWFDELLEKVFASNKINFKPIITDSDIYYSNNSKQINLIYLFGKYNLVSSIALTKKAIGAKTKANSRLLLELGPKLATYPVVLIGFSNSSFQKYSYHFFQLFSSNESIHVKDNYALVTDYIDQNTELSYKDNIKMKFICTHSLSSFLNDLAFKVNSGQKNDEIVSSQIKAIQLPEEPFKYLDYYTRDDEIIFKGRQTEIDELAPTIFHNRTLLLCGKSGVGKTSLINAGLLPFFEKKGILFCVARVLPSPLEGLAKTFNINLKLQKFDSWLDLVNYELDRCSYNKAIIVFDQFEELFTEFSNDAKSLFWQTVEKIVDTPNIPIHLIFSFREEVLPNFKYAYPHLPDPFGSIYFLDSLNKEQTKTVVKEIALMYGRPWSNAFIEMLLSDIGYMDRETAHLSIVLTVLWRKRIALQSNDIDLYESLGRASGILKNYLWDEIDRLTNKDKIKEVIKAFVSPEKRKSRVSIEDLTIEMQKKGMDINPNLLAIICNQLIDLRLIRLVTGDINVYELSHDCLAEEISKTVSEDDINRKVARRSIREIFQSWQLTLRLPNRAEHTQFENNYNLAGAYQEEKLLLILSRIHNGYNLFELDFNSLMNDPEIKDKLLNLIINSKSLNTIHYLLTYFESDPLEIHVPFIRKLIDINKELKPSLNIHLENVLNKYKKLELISDGVKVSPVLQLINIPTGKYMIGTLEIDIQNEFSTDLPKQLIELDSFYIDRFMVTNLDYKIFLQESKYKAYPATWINGQMPKNSEYHPVTGISWFEAAYFAYWNKKRLPTEAEWLVAGYYNKSLNKLYEFPWGDNFNIHNANFYDSNYGYTTPIGTFHPDGDSPFGLCDIAGNAFEWLLDDNVNPPKIFTVIKNPVALNNKTTNFKSKMTRGGSFGGNSPQLSSKWRQYTRDENTKDEYIGFRCVKSDNDKLMELMKERLITFNIIE